MTAGERLSLLTNRKEAEVISALSLSVDEGTPIFLVRQILIIF